MDHPAALHGIRVGLPATVDQVRPGKWVAQTTQVLSTSNGILRFKIILITSVHETELYHLHGRLKTTAMEVSATSHRTRARYGICEV